MRKINLKQKHLFKQKVTLLYQNWSLQKMITSVWSKHLNEDKQVYCRFSLLLQKTEKTSSRVDSINCWDLEIAGAHPYL